jgi:four helix bundle protein
VSASDFRDLLVWQKGRALAIDVYKVTDEGRVARDFGLRDQLRRSAVSICSNIAEGNDRSTDRDTVHFLYVAKGSAAELISHLSIAQGIGYLEEQAAARLTAATEEVSRMLRGLIKTRMHS